MYNTKNIVELITLEEIFKRVTEYDIFSFYLGHPIKLGQAIKSPLRNDNHPSFGIFKSRKGILLFKDQATGESGNCIKFVQLLLNINNYNELLQTIWNDMIIKNNISKSKVGKSIENLKISNKKQILIKRKYFTKTDEEYWSQYYISKDTLKKYNVFPIESFWIDDIKYKFIYTKDSPMYAYKMFNSFKIYRPYAKNKADKWRTNCTKYDIQGWEQLPDNGDTLVITKSLKDIMVLSHFNIASIAPHSEVSLIPKEVIDEAKKRFKRLVVFYDNDESGKEGAERIKNEYNLETIFIPTHYLDIYNVKDISDFVKEFGIDKTKELLNEILCH